jgi:undecaprenol kinase
MLQRVKNQSFIRRLGFAWNGLRSAYTQERSLRTQLWCLLLVVAVLVALRPPAIWWALCLLSSALVVALELINTALEQALDRLHPEQHENMRIAKDCAAAAVLSASIGAAVVGVMTVLVGLGWL